MLRRALVSALSDSGPIQVAQVRALDSTLDGVERFGEWGLLSRPPVGASGVVAFLGASQSHGVLVGVEDRRYRPTDADEGESGLYTTDSGTEIRVKPDGTITIEGSGEVRIESTGADVTVVGSGTVRLEGGEATITGTTKVAASSIIVELGQGPFLALLDQRLHTWLQTVQTWLDNHVHQSPVGGLTSNPTQSSPTLPAVNLVGTTHTKAS